MEAIEAGGGNCCGWIPVSKCPPPELTDHIHSDELSYEVTIQNGAILDISFCRFQSGHWWKGNVPADAYVTVWGKRPAPYQHTKKGNCPRTEVMENLKESWIKILALPLRF